MSDLDPTLVANANPPPPVEAPPLGPVPGQVKTQFADPAKSTAEDSSPASDAAAESAQPNKSDQQQMEEDGFTVVPPKGGVAFKKQAPNSKSIGVRVIRNTEKDKTAYNFSDLLQLFQHVKAVDPAAFIRDYKNDPNSEKPIASFCKNSAAKFLTAYLDIDTINWGPPSSNQARSYLSFYIVSAAINPGLRELREDNAIRHYLKQGSMNLQSHELAESKTKVLGFLFGKDPRHTFRQGLARRCAQQ